MPKAFWSITRGVALPAHPDLVAAFSSGLRDGTLPPGLTAHQPGEAARRFAVYRNNVTVGLTDALSKRFPVIERLVGRDFFAAMARLYIDAHRPRSPVLLEWGDTFPAFLADFPPLSGYPYMAEVAQIELARGQAFHAADIEPIDADNLMAAAADPSRARIGLHPSVRVLPLSSPAVYVWTVNQPGDQSTVLRQTGAQTALILRDRNFAVPVIAITPGDATLINALGEGQTILVAASLAAFAEPDHDPQPMLLHLMQSGSIIPYKDTP